MLKKQGLCSDGAYAIGSKEFGDSDDQVNGEDEQFAHRANATTIGLTGKTARKARFERQFINSPSTGSVFSRLPEHIELARGRFRVGNLYINRLSRRNASVAATLDVVRRALPREAAEGAAPAGSGSTNAQAQGLTNASNEAFLAGERPVLRGPTEGASGPPNMGRQSLR